MFVCVGGKVAKVQFIWCWEVTHVVLSLVILEHFDPKVIPLITATKIGAHPCLAKEKNESIRLHMEHMMMHIDVSH